MKIWKPDDPLPGHDVFEDEEPYDKSWIFEDPQSEEIIQQLGFDKPTAAHLWRRWSEWAEEGGAEFDCATRDVPFLALVKGRVEFSDDVWGDDDAVWIQWMQKHGIAAELQDAIMDPRPRFKQLRLTRTCEQWVLDTIDMRYKTFYKTHTKSKSERGGDIQDTEHEHSGDTVNNLVPEETPGVTVLYKAIALGRFWNTTCPILDSEGRLCHMGSLYRLPLRSIFNRSWAMIYLGTSLETAQLHASYLRRLSSGLGTQVAIVRLCVPDIALETKAVQLYFPSDDWKKLVWYCQTNERDQELRQEMSRFWRAHVIVGNVTNRPEEAFSELDSWEDITEKYLLKLDGNTEGDIHYAFRSEGGEEWLQEHVTDAKIIPYSTEEYLQWMEEHQDLSQRNITQSYCCLQ
ncbi:hypothetical protein FIE12Z_4908 [Fusarium flagelliforme]|uniref:Uncharacterized protein n=1 Tax=Fusarium flagelliforme TaxID=2675880 RepID=A0A395MSD0_9HYPO|nr:hypothetical protein FIE12Z_4908 [Fusarium flagelliforme]